MFRFRNDYIHENYQNLTHRNKSNLFEKSK